MQQLDLFGKYDAMEYAVSLNISEMYHLREQNEILYYKVRELRREAAMKRHFAKVKTLETNRKIAEQVRRATFIAKVDGHEFTYLNR